MTGRIHSVQSMGAVDGPGLRYVVFLQGCPLRCLYCHNPDTWDFEGGEEIEAKAMFKRIFRMAPYFASGGGVTVSGGEPLMQADFVAELFTTLRAMGIHTALDTSCVVVDERAKMVLEHTDLLLADLKFATAEEYEEYTGAKLETVESFLSLAESMNVPAWVRHVVVPGLNDSVEDMRRIKSMAEKHKNVKKVEFLPFHNMCLEKYESMGIDFPLRDTPAMSKETLEKLEREI